MSSDNDGILEAARAIRPYLNDLVSPAAAGSLDRRIADQLTSLADRAASADHLRVILEEQEDTAWFMSRVLSDKPLYRPPYHQPVYKRDVVSPAGDPGFIEADRYACPRGDFVWYRPDVGTPVPDCLTHHAALTRS